VAEFYPLKMQSFLREIVWGGRKLARYGKTLPEGKRIAESWEVSAHPDGLSRVAEGELAGRTIPELASEFGEALLGADIAARYGGDFPLLVKLLDADDRLSVQVHPDDAAAKRLEPGRADTGKSEAWVVLEAEPDAFLYRGLEPGTTRAVFEGLLRARRVEECLHRVEVRPGDCVPIPAGTVHCISAGIVLAEVQQTSDLTYRVWDWERVGLDGKHRELHVDKALEVIDFDLPVGPGHDAIAAEAVDQGAYLERTLVAWPKLAMNLTSVKPGARADLAPPEGKFLALLVLKGEGALSWRGREWPARPGDSFLVPASAGFFALSAGDEGIEVLRATA